MGKLSFCATATICSTPGECQSEIENVQLAALIAIVAIPVVGASLPILLASSSSNLAFTPRANSVSASGMLVVLVCLVLGYSPTFFSLLTARYPCATAIGSCASISCACGNYYEMGYTWMAVVLITCSSVLVREFAPLPTGLLRSTLIFGSLCIMTPGVFPERFETNLTEPVRFLSLSYSLHVLGLGLAMLLLVALPFGLICNRARRRLGWPARARVLLPRGAHALSAAAFAFIFVVYRGTADVSDYCAHQSPHSFGGQVGAAATSCAAWPTLSATDCAAVSALPRTAGHPVPVTYTCDWVNGSLSRLDELLLPGSYALLHEGECKKGACRLYVNARSIALEFGMLFLMGRCIRMRAIRWPSDDQRMTSG
jgi:hypothetical protein